MIDSFVLQEGGVSENPERYYVKLTHHVDLEILKMVVNKYAEEGFNDLEQALDTTFNGIEYIENLDNITTFYY